jgi:hypothetical protein
LRGHNQPAPIPVWAFHTPQSGSVRERWQWMTPGAKALG